MTDKMTIIGTPVSPYVRKVLAILDMKGVPFRCIPQVPYLGDENFTKISPLRRIPVMQIGDFTLPDSTAIVQYLDEAYPETPAYPGDIQSRARARWFEEYADDHLGRNVLFKLFFQRMIRPRLFKEEPDEAIIAEALEKDMPQALDYLEGEVPEDGFLAGDISAGDIVIATLLKNALWAGWQLDGARWPRFAAWLARVNAVPAVAKVNALADEVVNAKPKEQLVILRRYYGKG
ncbi:MAG: glutathione S-transferase family protein [Alphaproteobacteria bacterium]|nr:glutathione S-transferase family protein [Alphaproteobacteria bacterium]